MSLYKRGQTWWIDIVPAQGERVRESTRTSDRASAQRYHDERKADLWATPHPGGLTWQGACVAWLKAGERSASDRYSLRALNYKDRLATECTPESFEIALSTKSPATFNRYRALIVAILNHSGIKIKIPTKRVKTGRLRFLTQQEWQRLYQELPSHLRPIATLSLATGLRQHNATHLRWDQVDLRRKVLWIHPDEAKAKKAIGVPLSSEAVDVIRGQIGLSDEWVFPYSGRGRKQGQPLGKIKRAWQEALKRAKIDDFTWHGLRHTWASWHIMNGTPIEVLQKLGGWEDLRMVQRYTHLAPEYLAGFAGNAKPYVSQNVA